MDVWMGDGWMDGWRETYMDRWIGDGWINKPID